MSNPVVTAAIYDPTITDPAATNIVTITQGRLGNLLSRSEPFLIVEQGRFDLQNTHRIDGDPPMLSPLAV